MALYNFENTFSLRMSRADNNIQDRHWSERSREISHRFEYQPIADGILQDCSISIANALEILQYCAKPSMWPTACVLGDPVLEVAWSGVYRRDVHISTNFSIGSRRKSNQLPFVV